MREGPQGTEGLTPCHHPRRISGVQHGTARKRRWLKPAPDGPLLHRAERGGTESREFDSRRLHQGFARQDAGFCVLSCFWAVKEASLRSTRNSAPCAMVVILDRRDGRPAPSADGACSGSSGATPDLLGLVVGLLPLATLPLGWILAHRLVGISWAEFSSSRAGNFALWAFIELMVQGQPVRTRRRRRSAGTRPGVPGGGRGGTPRRRNSGVALRRRDTAGGGRGCRHRRDCGHYRRLVLSRAGL